MALITCAAVVLTADIPLAIISLVTKNVNVIGMGLLSKVMLLPLIRPAPLVLLILTIAYAIAYARRIGNQSPIEFASSKTTVHT
jgi:hypothetical protein